MTSLLIKLGAGALIVFGSYLLGRSHEDTACEARFSASAAQFQKEIRDAVSRARDARGRAGELRDGQTDTDIRD